jgi:anthranilate/para-aminobenzoate synthase component II
MVFHEDTPLYEGIPNPVEATRYHSLLVEEDALPNSLVVDARTGSDEIMGLHHVSKPRLGVQFHPESILTDQGRTLISNFLEYAKNPHELGDAEMTSTPSTGAKETSG